MAMARAVTSADYLLQRAQACRAVQEAEAAQQQSLLHTDD